MTVREWFRVQRGALWATSPILAADIDTVASALVDEVPILEWRRIGPFYQIESVESYEARERVLALVRADMDRALNRLAHTGGITE